MGQNQYLNLLHNLASYKEVYEWDSNVLWQEFKTFRALNVKLHPNSMCHYEWTLPWAHKTWSFTRHDTHVYNAHTPHNHPKNLPTFWQSKNMNIQGNFE
jgi:hypothetical protein